MPDMDYIKSACRTVDEARAALPRRFRDEPWIGFGKLGGIGDLMQVASFARAVRRKYPAAPLCLVFKNLGEDADGRSLVENVIGIGSGDPVVDVFTTLVTIPQVNWGWLMSALQERFDIFFEVQYVVGGFYNRPADAGLAARAEQALRRWLPFYLNFPSSSYHLGEWRMTQFELMAKSSGFDVTEDDLAIACAPHGLDLPARYITVHVTSGGGCETKMAPREWWETVVRSLKLSGWQIVQIGSKYESRVKGTVDARGTSINGTAEILRG
ncbi:MAG TPA: hypothetical protein VM223_13570, partial [Planctomycetota bacterium]|nr:hypothetical protein [Planctomycetota bacterium]